MYLLLRASCTAVEWVLRVFIKPTYLGSSVIYREQYKLKITIISRALITLCVNCGFPQTPMWLDHVEARKHKAYCSFTVPQHFTIFFFFFLQFCFGAHYYQSAVFLA